MSGMSNEATLTRFFIFEPDDTGLVWTNVAQVLAHDKESARNKHYKGRAEPVACCVVSENQWKPETWIPKVVRPATSQPFQMPTVDATVGQQLLHAEVAAETAEDET